MGTRSYDEGQMARGSFILGIAGRSASGKSTLARKLVSSFPQDKVALVPVDCYYRARNDLSLEQRALINYDHPDALELDLLAKHLSQLRSGEAVDVPHYDFSQHNRVNETFRIEPKSLIVIEGILTFADPRVVKETNFKVFVETSPEISFARRKARDVLERGRTEESVLWQWNETVEPMYREHCEPTKALADIVVDGTEVNQALVESVINALRECPAFPL